MTQLSEVLKTFDTLDKTLTKSRACLMDAKEVPVECEMRLPDPKNIRDFYSDYILFKMAKMTVERDSLTLRTHTQTIQVSLLGILELLSNKLQLPVVCVPEQKTNVKPPFIPDIDAIIQNKMSWIKVEFNKIMAVDDPRINRMCQDYYRVQSYPLIVRLNYLERERQFIAYHIAQTETRLEDKKTLELEEIRKQYSDRLDKEKSGLNLRISNKQNELRRMKTVNDRLDGLFQSTQTENTAMRQEVEALYSKLKGNEEAATGKAQENSALRAEVETLKNKLNRYESAEWKPDFTSTNSVPVFCNLKDNFIIKFPCSLDDFKRDYSLSRINGSSRVYTNGAGKEFIIPDSLSLKLPSMLQQEQTTGSNGKDIQNILTANGKDVKVTEGVKTVYEFLKNNGDPASAREIMDGTGIAQSTISARHLKTLREIGVLEEEDAGRMKKYSIIIPRAIENNDGG